MDSIDTTILNLLQNDARISNADIARRVKLAPSAVLGRVRRLHQKKLILNCQARLNARAMGLELMTFVLIRTDENVGSTAIGKRLAEIPEVQEVHFIAGEYCYLLKVRVKDTDALAELLKVFGGIRGILITKTTLVLSTIKESSRIPLEIAAAPRRKQRKAGPR